MSYEVTIDRIGAQALFDLKGDAGAGPVISRAGKRCFRRP